MLTIISHVRIIDYALDWVQLENGEWVNVSDLPSRLDTITEEHMQAAAEIALEDLSKSHEELRIE